MHLGAICVEVHACASSFRQGGNIHTQVSYTHLADFLGITRAKRGIAVGRRLTDRCPICKEWDTTVEKDISHNLRQSCELLQAQDPNYFDGFHTHVKRY